MTEPEVGVALALHHMRNEQASSFSKVVRLSYDLAIRALEEMRDREKTPAWPGAAEGGTMIPEWEELKAYVKVKQNSYYAARIYDKMEEIERRTLPKRVAELLDKTNTEQFGCDCRLVVNHGRWLSHFQLAEIFKVISHSILTRDLSELEKWQKK